MMQAKCMYFCFNQSCNQLAISKIRKQCYDIDGAAAMVDGCY